MRPLGKDLTTILVTWPLTRTNSYCPTPCCGQRIKETVHHVLGLCAAYAVPRDECYAKIGFRGPSFLPLSPNAKVDYILGVDTSRHTWTFIFTIFIKNLSAA